MKGSKGKLAGTLAVSLCLASSLALGACSSGTTTSSSSVASSQAATQAQQSYPVTVTDALGRDVEVQSADHVVTLCATGFDRMLVLGQADRVVGNFGKATEWATYVNKGVAPESLGGGNVAGNPDVESLNALDTDVLYCWQEAIEAGNVTDPEKANFAAVCAQLSKGNPTTVSEYKDYLEKEIHMYSDALCDEEASQRAGEWVDYMNEKFDYVTSRTSGLSDSQKVKVYYARGGKDGSTPTNGFLKYSYPDFAIQMAGGINVADEADAESYGDVTAEQIAAWNPQVIFCGRMTSKDAITGNDAFTGTDAVANGKVYLSPAGVMEWDTGSECVLNTLYIAKTLHPDLFQDLDMNQEIKDYYQKFYDTDLTDAQVNNILNHLGPNA